LRISTVSSTSPERTTRYPARRTALPSR
jgi:hypothetical protein